MRCAEIEAETREEVMKEMKERMKTMQQLYTRRLMTEVRGLTPSTSLFSEILPRKQVEQNELKTDAKIDLLHRSRLAGMLTTEHVATRRPEDVGEEEDVAMNLASGCQTAPDNPVIDNFE
jgi:kinesin family member 20